MEYETITGNIIGKANNYMIGTGRNGEQRIIKNERIRAYEKEFTHQCTKYKDKHIKSRFRLHADVYYSSNAFDLDNSLKTLLDCLQYVKAIENDSQCVSIIANKHIDYRNPRVVFAIEEYEPTLQM